MAPTHHTYGRTPNCAQAQVLVERARSRSIHMRSRQAAAAALDLLGSGGGEHEQSGEMAREQEGGASSEEEEEKVTSPSEGGSVEEGGRSAAGDDSEDDSELMDLSETSNPHSARNTFYQLVQRDRARVFPEE